MYGIRIGIGKCKKTAVFQEWELELHTGMFASAATVLFWASSA